MTLQELAPLMLNGNFLTGVGVTIGAITWAAKTFVPAVKGANGAGTVAFQTKALLHLENLVKNTEGLDGLKRFMDKGYGAMDQMNDLHRELYRGRST